MTTPDPGYRDLDNSASFEGILATLDHFNTDPSVRAARPVLYCLLRPRPGRRILDAGCGPGFDVAALSPKVTPGGLVFGLDLSARMIEIARHRLAHLDGVDFKAASIESTGLPSAHFDASFALRTVQYLDEPVNAIQELARVTKPGSLIAVIEDGMAGADLPDAELTRLIFGPRAGLAIRQPNLFRDCGLEKVSVKPVFSTTEGSPDQKSLEYARSRAETAVDHGEVSAADAEAWLAQLDAIVAKHRWYSVDCVFIVLGTVPMNA
jgi:ubiquinone/menaquinone biosynthesis C-methylase UbiE